MAIQPKTQIPSIAGQRLKYISATTLGTTPVSLQATFAALGIPGAAGYWIGNDEASGADLKVGDSVAQPIAIKAGGDIFLPSRGNDVWIVAASGTITFYAICIGT